MPEMMNNGKRDLLLSQMYDRSIIILSAVAHGIVPFHDNAKIHNKDLALANEVAGMCIPIIYFN